MIDFTKAITIIQNAPEFDREYRRLRFCDIKKKPWWYPYKNFYSTLGNTVYYPEKAEFTDPLHQASILVHEATHLIQWDRLGFVNFSTRYAQAAGRLALEKDAFRTQFLWWIIHGRIPHPRVTNNPKIMYTQMYYVGGAMRTFHTVYKISHIVSFDNLMDWATEEIVALFAQYRPG